MNLEIAGARREPIAGSPNRSIEDPAFVSLGGPTFAAINARSYHSGGVNTLLGDGGVRPPKTTINGLVWRALGTVVSGEVGSNDFGPEFDQSDEWYSDCKLERFALLTTRPLVIGDSKLGGQLARQIAWSTLESRVLPAARTLEVLMKKPITRMMHGIGDWLLIPVVAASPYLVGFADVPTARSVAWIASIALLVSVVCTRAEWGLIRLIPYRMHLLVDAGFGTLLLLAPMLFDFSRVPAARNTFLVLGAGLITASLALSRPEEMPGQSGVTRTTFVKP